MPVCSMGQRLAKRDLAEGLRLYRLQRQEAAVRMWRKALRRLTSRRDRFQALGYLAAAYCDWGKYRDMLSFAVQQIDLANEADNSSWRAEAYLNLARSNEHLCEYHKAISYCQHSLTQATPDPSVHAYVYLCLANAYLGYSNFVNALENYERTLRAAKVCNDVILELQVYTSLGHLFSQLQDFEKGHSFYSRAADLVKGSDLGVSRSLYERQTIFNMAVSYKDLGRLKEAMDGCENALKLSLAEGDRPLQAKCLCCLGDLYRKHGELQKAYPRYEAAISLMVETGDRASQMHVLSGLAKTLTQMQKEPQAYTCECQALEYNAKSLDIARSIGNKLEQMKCHTRMMVLYRSLGDHQMEEEEEERVRQLILEMSLVCGVCGQGIGEPPERLDALPCCHIVHSRCAAQLCHSGSMGRRTGRLANCPSCRQSTCSSDHYS